MICKSITCKTRRWSSR